MGVYHSCLMRGEESLGRWVAWCWDGFWCGETHMRIENGGSTLIALSMGKGSSTIGEKGAVFRRQIVDFNQTQKFEIPEGNSCPRALLSGFTQHPKVMAICRRPRVSPPGSTEKSHGTLESPSSKTCCWGLWRQFSMFQRSMYRHKLRPNMEVSWNRGTPKSTIKWDFPL